MKTRRAVAALCVTVALCALGASLAAVERQRVDVGRSPSAKATPARSTEPATVPSGSSTVPNVVGMTLATAQRSLIASGHGALALKEVASEVVARGVAPETVIAQTDGKFTISVPSAPRCTQGQLAATYLFNQGAVGNWYAGIVLRNISSTWCALGGPVHLVGLSDAAQPVTTTMTVTFSNPRADVLSPNTSPAPKPPASTLFAFDWGGYPIGVLYAWVGFGGVYGVCQPPEKTSQGSEPHVTPASWRLSVTQTFSLMTANGTPAAAAKLPTDTYAVRVARPFWSCGGNIEPADPAFR